MASDLANGEPVMRIWGTNAEVAYELLQVRGLCTTEDIALEMECGRGVKRLELAFASPALVCGFV